MSCIIPDITINSFVQKANKTLYMLKANVTTFFGDITLHFYLNEKRYGINEILAGGLRIPPIPRKNNGIAI